MGVSLFLVVLSNRTRGNRQKLMHRKFHLNSFTLQVTALNRLPREVVEAPSQWRTQACAMCSGCLSRELDQVNSVVLSNLTHPFWDSLTL